VMASSLITDTKGSVAMLHAYGDRFNGAENRKLQLTRGFRKSTHLPR
jgi:hypothetical protein